MCASTCVTRRLGGSQGRARACTRASAAASSCGRRRPGALTGASRPRPCTDGPWSMATARGRVGQCAMGLGHCRKRPDRCKGCREKKSPPTAPGSTPEAPLLNRRPSRPQLDREIDPEATQERPPKRPPWQEKARRHVGPRSTLQTRIAPGSSSRYSVGSQGENSKFPGAYCWPPKSVVVRSPGALSELYTDLA